MKVPLLDSLEGQVALVTGANRGMGAVIAGALQGMGAKVYAGAPNPEWKPPPGQVPVELDVTGEDTIETALEAIRRESGRLDVLVNNAGIAPGLGFTLATEPTPEMDEALAVNVRGPLLVTKHALPLLLRERGGRVVNLSSGMGSLSEGQDGEAPAYRISKTALNGLTVYLHGEFHASHGLIASSVCPGWVRTDIGGPAADRSPEEGAETPIWLCRFAPDAPGGLWWRDKEAIPW